MAFFDAVSSFLEGGEPPPPARPAWAKPEDLLPCMVAVDAVLAHTDAAAVALSGLWCYPNGFEFGVEAVLREPDRRGRLMDLRHHLIGPGEPVPPEMLRVGLRFSDGTKLTNLPGKGFPHGRTGPFLSPSSGSGGTQSMSRRFWVWPLPPPGPLTFVVEWPRLGIGESQTAVEARVVLDAAARVVPLWPTGQPAT